MEIGFIIIQQYWLHKGYKWMKKNTQLVEYWQNSLENLPIAIALIKKS